MREVVNINMFTVISRPSSYMYLVIVRWLFLYMGSVGVCFFDLFDSMQ